MKSKLAVILTLAVLLFSGMTWASADDNALEGYHGIGWGTSLKEFKLSQKSSPADSVERLTARAVDYLMMNFNEVDKDDDARPSKFAVQKIGGDTTNYVFYDGRYCLAAVPIAPENVADVKKQIETKYPKKDSKTYAAYWDFRGDEGWLMMDFDYQQYAKSPGTRVYLVTTSSYYEDGNAMAGSKSNEGAVLIYVSDDYFKNADDAWADYQANKQAKPGVEKENKENRRQQDLSSIE
jgi:hypothetical protein